MTLMSKGDTLLHQAIEYWQLKAPSQPFGDWLPQVKFIEADKWYRYDDNFAVVEEAGS